MTNLGIYRNMTRNILKYWRSTDDETRQRGAEWYDEAFTICERAAWRHDIEVTRAVISLAHLSPRTTWAANVRGLDALLAGEPKPTQILSRSWLRGETALTADDPWTTFGPAAFKTRSFARAILGDPHAVVIDVWALRAAGAPENWPSTQSRYTALSDAYKRAARIEATTARVMQATTWIAIRGDHA